MQHHSELLGLIEKHLSNQLDDSQGQRLECLLQQPEYQSIFCYYMEIHAHLHWQSRFHSIACEDQPLLSLVEQPCFSGNCGDDFPERIRSLHAKIWTNSSWRQLALAAGLAGIVFLGAAWLWNGWEKQNRMLASLQQWEAGPQVELARVTGTMNCRWSYQSRTHQLESEDPEMAEFGYGSPLFAGQRIKLTQGLAEVTFSSGVKVVLEAPAELDVSAYNASFLYSGRMTAMVPDGAEGFEVGLNGWTAIDRGTEFGIATHEDGSVEVHVFNGLVEGHFGTDWGGHQGAVQWRQDTAVTVNSFSRSIVPLSDSQTKFVRSLSSVSPGNGLMAKEDFDYPAAPLAFQNGGFGWGGPWTILSTQEDASVGDTTEEGSLRYDGLFNSGGRAVISGGFDRARRILNTAIGGVFEAAGYIEDQDGARLIGRDGTTLYLSFLQRVSATGQEFYGVELNRGDGNRNRVLCFGHGAHLAWVDGPPRAPNRELGATGWSVTSEFNGPERNRLLELGDLGKESTETQLIVAKFEFGQENHDTLTVYLNPVCLNNESKCQPEVMGTGNFAFDQISLANFGGLKTFEVDHIRIGQTFESVMGHSYELRQLALTQP